MQRSLGAYVIWLLARAVRGLRAWLLITASYVLYWCSFLRFGSFVVARHPGAADLANARRVAVFVHYDRYGVVDDYVYYYLQCIANAGFCIVLVSNSPDLRATDLAKLRELCGLVILRKNVGLDFGAYKDGIAAIPDVRALDTLMLANDSVYGPIHHLGSMVEKMDSQKADVWGATDSWEIKFHLQSYFILFHSRVLASDHFAMFWKKVRCVQSKAWVIRNYEVGLTRHFQQGGFRCRALFQYREVATRITDAVIARKLLDGETLDQTRKMYLTRILTSIVSGTPMNGSHYFWDYLITSMAFPFIKRDLLHRNPVRIPFLTYWEQLIKDASTYDTDLILRHLERSLKNRSV